MTQPVRQKGEARGGGRRARASGLVSAALLLLFQGRILGGVCTDREGFGNLNLRSLGGGLADTRVCSAWHGMGVKYGC